jgi:hypothetical protein
MGQLLEAIADEANLAAAWTRVRANAGAAGVDGQTIAAFTADEEHQLASLRRRLLSAERYVPPPVRRVEIPKPDGRVRPLGIPTVADRVVQQATVVVDDSEVIGLVRRWLRVGVLTASGVPPGRTGPPQGGVISPLLANIYLHRLDTEVREAGFRLIRYADDFMILADRRWKVEAADRLVRAILADIGLEVAEAKSGIVRVRDGFEFLGFTFHGRFLRPRPRALTRFKDEVRRRTRRLTPVPLRQMIEDLNPVIRGWGNYYKVGDVTSLFEDLDQWIRMRLRSKVIRRHATWRSNAKMPNRVLRGLGLVSLDDLRRAYLSPA